MSALSSGDQKKSTKRESLLKPHFRKPAIGVVQKKAPARAPVVTETRSSRGKKAAAKNVSPNAQAIAHGRMNLLKALSKVKTEQVDNKEELDKFLTERCRATLGDEDMNIRFLRSDEDCSDKSSSYDGRDSIDGDADAPKPTRKRRSPFNVHSEESSDGDYMKKYPLMPPEPSPKTEYSQEEFLSLFRLITPQVAEKLKLRRSERKRRKCAKNEKNDFHYGNFDLNEVSKSICDIFQPNLNAEHFRRPHTEFASTTSAPSSTRLTTNKPLPREDDEMPSKSSNLLCLPFRLFS
jgi:hypothetical protein